MSQPPRWKVWAFYLAIALGMAVIIQGDLLAALLPTKLAAQVGNSGEGLLFAALVAATIQFIRHWAATKPNQYLAATPWALFCVALGIYLLYSGLPGSYATFSEPLVAAGLLTYFVLVPRPFHKALWLSVIMLVVIVAGFQFELVFKQSESLVALMLAPLAFDVFDRKILDPEAEERPHLLLAWCVLLAGLWLPAWRAANAVRPELTNPLEHAIDYAHRASEAYWGLLFVTLYFSYWLGKDWSARVDARHRRDGAGRQLTT
ncbi:MAG: hypothetical protein ACXWDM_09475 [Nocardioides sp.]